jgi:hypothetical protein
MNTFSKLGRVAKLALATLAIGALAACASTFRADVSRFESQLPAPAGQTFAVVADDPALTGGIEFRNYAQLVANHLAALGYTPADSAADAQLIVRFDYGVDTGRERVRSTGFYRDPFFDSWYGYRPVVYRTASGPRVAYVPYRTWGWGWNDSFFGGGGRDVYSYTVYTSGIELKIDRASDGQRVFEGKAEAASTSNRLQYLVPNLIEAMFTDFPGNSGETVRISVAPENESRR